MMQPIYIVASSAITPQHTYKKAPFLEPLVSVTDRKLFNQEADYTRFISPVAIRRMSRLLKAGITAGMAALQNADIESPGAIIIGTSRGSVTDMETFLKDMIRLEEEALNPTFFIQSTYNSVNGWLAVIAKCSGYNQAFVHRGFSFELAIFDAIMYLNEHPHQTVLAGCFDELTDEYFKIREKIGYYKTGSFDSLSLLERYDTPGSIAGEGAHFFVLSTRKEVGSTAILGNVMLYQPTLEALTCAFHNLMESHRVKVRDIDTVVSGMNGDLRNREQVFAFNALFSGCATIVSYKQLSGEFATASGFGLWLANEIITTQHIDDRLLFEKGTSTKIETVLLFNITINNNVSLTLLKRAG